MKNVNTWDWTLTYDTSTKIIGVIWTVKHILEI